MHDDAKQLDRRRLRFGENSLNKTPEGRAKHEESKNTFMGVNMHSKASLFRV